MSNIGIYEGRIVEKIWATDSDSEEPNAIRERFIENGKVVWETYTFNTPEYTIREVNAEWGMPDKSEATKSVKLLSISSEGAVWSVDGAKVEVKSEIVW